MGPQRYNHLNYRFTLDNVHVVFVIFVTFVVYVKYVNYINYANYVYPTYGVDILKGKSIHSQEHLLTEIFCFLYSIVAIDAIVTIDFIGVFLFRKRFGQLVLLGFMSPLYTCSLSTS